MNDARIQAFHVGEERSTREKILLLLKTHGAMTVKMLSEELGITPMGVRRHLTAMERDGLVKHEQRRQVVGRPAYYFKLTPEAENLFPKSYDALAVSILKVVSEKWGSDKVKEIAEELTREEMKGAEEALGDKRGADRVAAFVEFVNKKGFFATWEEKEPGVFEIYQYNCPFLAVAAKFPVLCSSRLNAMKQLFGDAEVTMEDLCSRGGSYGIYRIIYKK
jgi:predicted ArsR family transcriptional regulator